jgi:hypothetical protein
MTKGGMYRGFPANVEFNQAHRGPNQVPLFLAAGDKSTFAKLVPKIAEGLRASGFARVEAGLISDSVHYVVADQPGGGGRYHRAYASLHTE